MTQSITLDEPDGGEFAFNMMPPWKQSDVAFNLLQGTSQPEKSQGQKRRRGEQEQHVFNKEADNENTSSFANGFGIFPFRAPAAVATASVLLSSNHAEFRNHQRSLESAEAATAQAMANFQALIDQSRSSSGFQAYNSSASQRHSIPSFRGQEQQQEPEQQPQEHSQSNHTFRKEHSQPIHIFQKEHSQSTPAFSKENVQSNQMFSNAQSNQAFSRETLQANEGFFNAQSNQAYSRETLQANQGFSNSQTNHGYDKEHLQPNQMFPNFEVPTQTTSSAFNFFGDGLFQDSTPHSSYGGLPRETYSNSSYFGDTTRGVQDASISLGLGGPAETPLNFGDRAGISNGFRIPHSSVSLCLGGGPAVNGTYRTTSAMSLDFGQTTPESVSGFHRTTESENGAYHTTGSENGAYHTTESVNGYSSRSGVAGATGFHDTSSVSLELGGGFPWLPKLNCQTTTTERDYAAIFEPESPCTPRDRDTAVLSEAQEEYLQHIERLNAELDSPPQRGRRISYQNEPAAEHNYSIFHPFEALGQKQQQQQHIHIYFDESGMPQQFEDLPVAEAAVSETRDLFEECFATTTTQGESFEPVVEKETTRSIADQFDLNEVPVITVGEATTPPSKPRKKYHPRVAKDKRTYKRKVDGKKTPADAKTNSSPKKSAKKRGGGAQPTQTQYDEEGRDSSYPEVVDMEIEDMSTIGVPTTQTPHDTTICDCESCIKLRLESRRISLSTPPETSNLQSSPVSSPPDSSSNTQRTLFGETPPTPTPLEAPTSSEEQALTQGNELVLANSSSAYENVRSFFGSCLQQFNESAALLGFKDTSSPFACSPPVETNTSFMSRLCPRGILSPQKIAFRDMNPIQRVLYLKSILSSNTQLQMSPESLLRHVHEHLPEDEKQQFETSLWPSILKPLTEDQMKQLEDYANADTPDPSVKRKPGPKPKKVKELAMMLWPGSIKPAKPRKNTPKKDMQIVPYDKASGGVTAVNEESTGMVVPYDGGSKSVVAYEGPFNPLRKRKPRAKVVLDNETVRVWKLLMGKPGSGTENVTDAENELKWEEERRKMKNYALLFIDRMHIVQGDRSFSCWKGSVVDSVVGAFLTQNVNDVLSSSAFMCMRSRFPGRGFRKTPSQQPESEETVAQSFSESPSSQTSIAAATTSSAVTVLESTTTSTDHPLTIVLESTSTTLDTVTVLESQESRNDSDTLAKTCSNTQEESEVVNQPDQATMMNLVAVCSQSENSNSGLEYTSSDKELVVASETNGGMVEHDPSLGKYNPKTGLTGLERAQIEEKQVTARKSFDFSGLQDEFRPRLAGEQRPKAPPRTEMTEDGVDWEAVRAANVQEVADVIKERGLNWILAGRIKAFLERIHLDYGDLDLEWLRSMSTDQTKEFLLSIRGLGLKSVECIRLLTLHHLAFPVDTNVGRICVRLGWVPLEPLPEELQLHLLELYPVQATIQKYLWPRLCKLDQQTLYELHYQMITFGKVFCTKSKPNCNACPMRPECKHFASALSSAKLALPASERPNNGPTLALPPGTETSPTLPRIHIPEPSRPVSQYCQPIVEEPMTPESEADMEEFDMEDYPFTVEEVGEDEDLDPDLNICLQDQNLRNLNMHNYVTTVAEPVPVPVPGPVSEPVSEVSIMEDWGGLATSGTGVGLQMGGDGESSGSIKIMESVCEEVVLDNNNNSNNNGGESTTTSEVLIHPGAGASTEMVLVGPGAASIPVPKLKNVGRLRTVHYVYELPDNHPLLDGLDPREHDDPCTYLLAIWSPGEVPESIPNMNNSGDEENPFAAAASSDGEESIKATLLVPCRTAMRGSFPLNGTYFQVNEVFADHASSLQPMIVPRTLLWNLRRRFVFFGTSVTSIFRGMTVEEIQACFWRGYVCVRGFDRVTRAPKPLVGRLHLQAGKASEKKGGGSSANE